MSALPLSFVAVLSRAFSASSSYSDEFEVAYGVAS